MHVTQSKRQLRSFGLIVAAGFGLIGLLPLVRGHHIRIWSLAISALFAATALVAPQALRSVYPIWMRAGEALGWVNSRIILGVVYFVILSPIGALRRMLGHDPMQRKFDPETQTYRISRTKRPRSHLLQQY